MHAVSRLNGLQRMMLRWEEFHAVNAAHVVQLGRVFPVESVRSAALETCQALGLGPVTFHRNRTRFQFLDSQTAAATADLPETPEFTFQQFRTRGTQAEAAEIIQRFLDQQLNIPFASASHWPFRLALLETGQATRQQYLVMVYQHAVSDSRGISIVLREVLRTLDTGRVNCAPMRLDPPDLKHLFPRNLGLTQLPKLAWETIHEIIDSADCFKPTEQPEHDHSVESVIQTVGFPTEQLKAAARRHGVTVQDLLFAAVIESLQLHFWDELTTSRRQSLAVYAPVDLRHETPIDLSHALGQILGCITVRASVRRPLMFADLVERVSKQTRAMKGRHAYRDHSAHMEVMSRIWDVLPRSINRFLGPSVCPITGFISNVNLSQFLEHELASGLVRDYFRVTGTGLMVPMMFGITTVGPAVNFTTTHRRNVFTRADLERISTHILRRVTGQLAEVASREEFVTPAAAVAARAA